MKIFNTLSGEKEEFQPAGSPVKMYVCGITPYASCHMGHAMSYIIFDTLRRYLEYKGYKLLHVQNFTDIDDKIIERSSQLSVPPQQLASRYIEEFLSAINALNILPAHKYPRATEEIPTMLRIIQKLVATGHAYAAAGDVYFRVNKASGYGKLSRRSLEGMMAGARVEVGSLKEHPMDFTLWKAAKEGEPQWDSPWGPGRPGWHIECSAMSLKYLEGTVDIHGGGQDLIFPHHENEIAQSESYTGTSPFARYWVHNGLLQLGETKMSKSLGNLVTVTEALSRYSPDAIRLFVLSSHYRNPLTYTDDSLASSERGAERLRSALALEEAPPGGETLKVDEFKERFLEAMDDDFNSPRAVSYLFDLSRAINKAGEEGLQVQEGKRLLRELGEILGLTFKPRRREQESELSSFVELLIETRRELRAARQYALADRIRSRLTELGIILEDTSKGTTWRYKE